ncbi:hypothetical protein ACF0H5_020157 [Mactra antiquata]
MDVLKVTLLISIILGTSQAVNPCTQYSTIHDVYRSPDYVVPHVGYTKLLCDYPKFDGMVWYRFFNGSELTNKCTKTYHCGTHTPLWMSGSIPSPTAGVVSRDICYPSGDDSNCCDDKFSIDVKNCNGFMVYKLKSPPGCSMAYCAGTGVPCPRNTWSATGFGPKCIELYPLQLQSPHLSNPIVKTDTFEFHCDVNFNKSNTDIGFDVVWMFNNKTDTNVPGTTLTGSNRTAILDQKYLEHHMNEEVSCKVRAFNTKTQSHVKGPWVPSNVYWAGIKLSTTRITASEKGNSEKVDIISTVPIVCPRKDQHICHIDITLDSNNQNIQTTQKCTYQLFPRDWNNATNEARTTVEIQAQRDFQKDGDKNLELHFRPLFTADGPRIFRHYNISYLHVVAKDAASSSCKCYGDPHCKTFDYFQRTGATWPTNFYDFYQIGDYYMYKNTLKNGAPSQVQIRTWSCGKVTCICGVSAQEGNDHIEIDMCQGHYGHSFPQVTPERPTYSHGATMTSDTSGKNYIIDFPSGLQVNVGVAVGRSLTVTVTAPSDAQKSSGGLCGYFDGDINNDLKHPDGSVTPFSGRKHEVTNFTDSWRVPLQHSLFEQQTPLVTDPKFNPPLYYCNCDGKTGNPDCKFDNNIKIPAVRSVCAGCTNKVLQPYLLPNGQLNLNALNKGRKRRSAYDDADFKPSIYFFDNSNSYRPQIRDFPSENGKTRDDAEKACSNAFNKNTVLQNCITNAAMNFSTELDTCIEDYKYFDDGSFVDMAVEAAIDACRYTVLPDLSLYDRNGNPPSYITTDLCPNHCSNHGDCNTGICTCHHGYSGDGCEIHDNAPPTLDHVIASYKDSIACDVAMRPCRIMFVAGNNMKNTTTLTCKIHLYKFDGMIFVDTGRYFTTGSIYNNMYHVGCKLPTKTMVDGHTVVKYGISIANDGQQYSNTVEMVKTDSSCMICTPDGKQCFINDNACLIDGNCHRNGDTNDANGNEVCNPRNDKTKWTSIATTTKPATQAPQGIHIPVAALGGVDYRRFDIWTTSKTGCKCLYDANEQNCACCDADGVQCPRPNQHQCVKEGDTNSCGTPLPGPDYGVDGYTLALSDCTCLFDETKTNCACCQENVNACQCPAEHRNQCVNCDHMDQCGNKSWIFGPAFPN